MKFHLKHHVNAWPFGRRILCMDHGSKTLGLAVSNSDQTVVTPLETIHRTKWDQDKVRLDKIIRDYDVGVIVVGYPLNMDGSKGARCQSVVDFVTIMEQSWPDIPFFFFDERLSTARVDKILDNDKTKTRQKRKVFKDALAAQTILEDMLQWLRLHHPLAISGQSAYPQEQ